MARIVKPLTDTEIKKAKPKDKDYKLSDGENLYLVVKSNGTKFFRFDFTYAKKRKSMSFGIYPEVTLKEAREKRTKAREQLINNINPIESKSSNYEDIATFKYVADKWFQLMKREWKEVTYELNEERLKLHVYPYIGNKNISDIKISDILKIIQKLQLDEHFETSERILNTLCPFFRIAAACFSFFLSIGVVLL